MAHVRTQIRNAFKTALTGLSTTGSNVFVSRAYPLKAESFPALLIYNGPEASEPVDLDDATDRELDVIVEIGVFAQADQIDALLDQIAAEVEVGIQANQTFDGLAKNTMLTGTEPEVNIDGEMPLASLR